MGRPVTFVASDRLLQVIVPIAGQRQIELGNFRYGPTNIVEEFLDFIVDKHPEMFTEFAGKGQQAHLPGVEYRDVPDPEPEDRRGKHNGKHAASK